MRSECNSSTCFSKGSRQQLDPNSTVVSQEQTIGISNHVCAFKATDLLVQEPGLCDNK